MEEPSFEEIGMTAVDLNPPANEALLGVAKLEAPVDPADFAEGDRMRMIVKYDPNKPFKKYIKGKKYDKK